MRVMQNIIDYQTLTRAVSANWKKVREIPHLTHKLRDFGIFVWDFQFDPKHAIFDKHIIFHFFPGVQPCLFP